MTTKRSFWSRTFVSWMFRSATWRSITQATPGPGAITDQGGRIHILGGGPGRIFSGG